MFFELYTMKIILTGASGFVGSGVLQTCLEHPQVAEVLVVNRRSLGLSHPKLKELVVPDFMQAHHFTDQLSSYDACLYCAGISSVGLKEAAYTQITYDTTLHFAKVLVQLNPGMVFNFVSGSHTDGSEKSRIMWARVKGKTENALQRLPFRKAYSFRPGGMLPVPGQHNVKNGYLFIVRLIALLAPKKVCTLREVGLAMIHTVLADYPGQVLEIAAIKALGQG